MARFEKPLVLRVFGYVERGTAAAAANGVRQPFGFHRGACPSFGPSRSHGFGPGCRRTLFVFGLFGGSGGHPPIKNYGNVPAQDYGVHAIPSVRQQRGTATVGSAAAEQTVCSSEAGHWRTPPKSGGSVLGKGSPLSTAHAISGFQQNLSGTRGLIPRGLLHFPQLLHRRAWGNL